MKQALATLALLLLAPLAALGQSVKLPETATGKTGAWIIVPVVHLDGGEVQWWLPDARKATGEPIVMMSEASPEKGLAEVPLESLFGPDWAKAAKGRVFTSDVAGVFRVTAYCGKGDKASKIAVCVVTVGEPGPVPPGPVPPPPQPGQAPFPDAKFRAFIVYETADLGRLPASQLSVLQGKEIRDYLNSHCAVGPDGRTSEWRIWDQHVPAGTEAKHWQDLLARKRDKLPWLIVGSSTSWYEGPLPATVEETLALLKKYGG